MTALRVVHIQILNCAKCHQPTAHRGGDPFPPLCPACTAPGHSRHSVALLAIVSLGIVALAVSCWLLAIVA